MSETSHQNPGLCFPEVLRNWIGRLGLSAAGSPGGNGTGSRKNSLPNLFSGAVLGVFPSKNDDPRPQRTPGQQRDIDAAIAAFEPDPQPTGEVPTLPHMHF